MMAALAPEMDPVPAISPGDVEVGLAWTGEADPLVRARVEEAAAIFPDCRDIPLPALPQGIQDVRRRETAETHAKLFSEYRDRYGHDVAAKLDRCLEVTDRRVRGGPRDAGALPGAASRSSCGASMLSSPRPSPSSPHRWGSVTWRFATADAVHLPVQCDRRAGARGALR